MTALRTAARLDVQTALVPQEYLHGALVAGSVAFAVPNPATGATEVITSDGRAAYYTRRDPASDTGWSQVLLAFTVSELYVVPRSDGSRTVVARDVSPGLTPGATLHQLTYDRGRRTWLRGKKVAELPPAAVQQAEVFEGAGGALEVMSCTGYDPRAVEVAAAAGPGETARVGSYLWLAYRPGPAVVRSGERAVNAISIGQDPGRGSALERPHFFIDTAGAVRGGTLVPTLLQRYLELAPTPTPPTPFRGVQLRVLRGSVNTHLFARDEFGGLWWTRSPDLRSWLAWERIGTDPTLGETALSDFVPVLTAEGGIDLIGLGAHGGVVAMHLGSHGAAEWSAPQEVRRPGSTTRLDAIQATGPFVGTEVFCVHQGRNALSHLWHEGGEWREETVEQQSGGAPQSLQVYRTRVTAVDEQGLAVPGYPIRVSASRRATAIVQLRSVSLDATPAPLATDAGGALSIAVLANGAGAPELRLECDLLPRGALVVRPDAPVQRRLAALTTPQLTAARDRTTSPPTPVVPAGQASRTDDIRRAINAAMRVGLDGLAPDPSAAPFLAPTSYRYGIRYADAPDRPPAPGAGGTIPPSWRISRTDGRFVFEEVDPRAAAAARARANAAPASAAPRDPVTAGLLDDFVTWVETGYEEVEELFVDFVGGSWNLIALIDAEVGKYVTFGLDLLEGAFELLLAVADFVGEEIGTVLGWLASQFFQDWDAVKRNKDLLKAELRPRMSVLPAQLPLAAARAGVDRWFLSIENDVSAEILRLEALLGGKRTIGGERSAAGEWEEYVRGAEEALEWAGKVILDDLISALPEATLPTPTLDPGLSAALRKLLAALETDTIQELQATVDGTMRIVTAWFENLTDFSAATLSAILEELRQVIVSFFEYLRGVVDAILTFVEEVLALAGKVVDAIDQAVYIPYFSALYEGMMDEELSLLDVVCLTVAAPYTAVAGVESSSPEASGAPRAAAGIDVALAGTISMGVWATLTAGAEMTAGGDVVTLNPTAIATIVTASSAILTIALTADGLKPSQTDRVAFVATGLAVQLTSLVTAVSAIFGKSAVRVGPLNAGPLVTTLGSVALMVESITFLSRADGSSDRKALEYLSKLFTSITWLGKVRLVPKRGEIPPEENAVAVAWDLIAAGTATAYHAASIYGGSTPGGEAMAPLSAPAV